MNRILIVPVNYNSYKSLDAFLESVVKAHIENCNDQYLEVAIADNSSNKQDIELPAVENLKASVVKLDNLGYLGGALHVINNTVDVSVYDYVAICNVDLTVAPDFFQKLEKTKFDTNIGWIAPSIYSSFEERDRNPKILHRPSKKRMTLLKMMYRFPVLHKLYTNTLYKRKKFASHNPGIIYGGHGSFMMLTREFFKRNKNLCYPVFLFGEEIFLAELCRISQLTTYFCPDLQVLDCEHVSTGEMKSEFYYKCNHDAIAYLLKEYYE